MLSTEQFYEAFDAAGFLLTATWTSSPANPKPAAQVRFRAPARDVLGGDQFTTDYTIRYPATQLVGLKRKETVTITGRGTFSVIEDPESRLDGTEREAKLAKVSS